MTEDKPTACSLDGTDLQLRLAAIAELGGRSLLGRSAAGGRHRLRFSGGSATREQLEWIVAAEARCCPFLDLELREEGRELVLEIGAPAEGRAVADELAAAFEP